MFLTSSRSPSGLINKTTQNLTSLISPISAAQRTRLHQIHTPKLNKVASTVTSGTRKFEENSHIKTCCHEYYRKYSIPGFDPIVYSLPTQSKPVEKVSTVNVKAKKIVFEDNSHITTCNHEYYEKYSIAGFKPINHVPTPTEVTKKEPAKNIDSQEEEENDDDDDMDPYDHDYYKNYSIAGLNPIQTPSPAQPDSTKKPTNNSLHISKAKALAIAAVYTPSHSSQKTIDQEYSNVDHDIDMCAQTIESLEWEVLGITGARAAGDDMGEGEVVMKVEGKKEDGEAVQWMERGDVILSGMPAICLFMGMF